VLGEAPAGVVRPDFLLDSAAAVVVLELDLEVVGLRRSAGLDPDEPVFGVPGVLAVEGGVSAGKEGGEGGDGMTCGTRGAG